MNWRILPLMMVFAALAHFNRLSMGVAGAEVIIPTESLSEKQIGSVYTVFLIVYSAMMIPGGWFLDRFGPRRAWLVVGFGTAITTTLTGVIGWCCHSPTALLIGLLVARGLAGAVSAPLHPTAARLAADWTSPAWLDLANGLVTAAACFGMATTYVGFGALIDAFGWQGAFVATGLFTFAVSVIWFVMGADRPPQSGSPTGSSPMTVDIATTRVVAPMRPRQSSSFNAARTLYGNASLWFLTLSYGMVGYFQYLFLYWAEHFFRHQLEMTVASSRWATSLLSVGLGVGMVVGSWASDQVRGGSDRWHRLALAPMIGMAMAGIATVIAAELSDATGIVAFLAMAMLAIGSCEGAHWTTAVRIGQDRGGAAAAIMNTGGNAVGLLAPMATPWIGERFGWSAVLIVGAGACWAGGLAWLGIRVGKQTHRAG